MVGWAWDRCRLLPVRKVDRREVRRKAKREKMGNASSQDEQCGISHAVDDGTHKVGGRANSKHMTLE